MSEYLDSVDDDLTPEDIVLRDICRNLSDEEFFAIKPIWCTNPEDLQLGFKHPFLSGDIYVECDLDRLIALSDNLSNVHFSRRFDGEWWEEERYCKTLIERWQKGLGVDPPDISFRSGRIIFGDGRHRTVLAKALGDKTIIVRINPQMLEVAQQLVGAKIIDL